MKVALFVVFLALFLSFPFLMELFLNKNTSLFLAYDNWINFLGSYVGGALGGLGTLFAVHITTTETRKIQKKTLDQIEEDRRTRSKNERKIFSDEVAKDVSKYIANICVYFYGSSREFYLQGNKKNAQAKLNNINFNLESSPEAKQEEDLKKTRENIIQQISEIEKDIAKYEQTERSISVEYYYLLKIKLSKIKEGENLLFNLQNVHEKSTDIRLPFEKFHDEIDKLQIATVTFAERYIK